jgi:hypothetical protein
MALTSLPKELLRQICSHLPCQSAFKLLLVCRFLRQTCDDWTVWRAIVTQSALYPSSLPLLGSSYDAGWKQYAMASAKAENRRGNHTTRDLEEWLPQLAALRHRTVLQCDILSFSQLYDSTFHDLTSRPNYDDTVAISGDRFDDFTLQTWLLAQAAAFSLTMRLLLQPNSRTYSRTLMCTGPWRPTQVPTRETQKKLVVMQHALANRAVGFFCARLRSARAGLAPAPGLFQPPSAATVPLLRQMTLPVPFTALSLDTFNTCHVSAMANPEFLTLGDWTGCITMLGQREYSFNAIGGRHHDGFDHPGGSAPPGFYPHGRSFEGVVRFRPTGSDGRSFQLQSNNFYSEAGLHRLRLAVDRRTAQVTIHHWHPMMANFMVTEGVITPFGIVSWLLQPGYWMWLWKVEWSTLLE